MLNEEIVLNRNCPATLIPAGDHVNLPQGTSVYVTQALGGTITVRAKSGLFRIDSRNLDALGEAVAEAVASGDETVSGEFSEDLIWEALRSCYDPEIPINIVDLGLIYNLSIEPRDGNTFFVDVKMTLTAQGCGMGPVIAEDAKTRIEALPQVESAKVDIVWEPVWTPQMISEEGKKKLGLT
jgi:probable FeS assembly SUF system protein SufT